MEESVSFPIPLIIETVLPDKPCNLVKTLDNVRISRAKRENELKPFYLQLLKQPARDVGPRGEFYLGADFRKHVDYSVVAVVEKLHGHLYLRHCHRFPLETSYGAVIGYMRGSRTTGAPSTPCTPISRGLVTKSLRTWNGEGLRNVTGVNFTDQSKEAMATCLKEKMRSTVCPNCGWEGHVNTLKGT